MNIKEIIYPTIQHQEASKVTVGFFSEFKEVKAILLVGSCARNKATRDSCLDINILLNPESFIQQKEMLEKKWLKYYKDLKIFKKLLDIGQYSHIDLDFTDGQFIDEYHGWTTGPDNFELEIGNILQYSVALYENGDYYNKLKKIWLPYYDENKRLERLNMVLKYCHNNLDHIPLFVKRGLYFQAFNRFYDAYREFLQALFISRKIYPIAYDKWIKEQIIDILQEKKLYNEILELFAINNINSDILIKKKQKLEQLILDYVN